MSACRSICESKLKKDGETAFFTRIIHADSKEAREKSKFDGTSKNGIS